jgi:hypothetical protein
MPMAVDEAADIMVSHTRTPGPHCIAPEVSEALKGLNTNELTALFAAALKRGKNT